MKTRRIGSLEVSVVGFGANNFTNFFGNVYEEADARRLVDAVLDAGITLIDTAEEYSTKSPFGDGQSEQLLGAVLGKRRKDVIIATKYTPNLQDRPNERGRARVIAAVEESLKRLRTDYIDLYQQHFPDPDVPIDELLEANDRLVKDGKVREIGCCNFTEAMIDDAIAASESKGISRYASVQTQYNVLDLPTEGPGVLDAVKRHNLMVLPYFPLASGVLTGKYKQGQGAPAGSRFDGDTAVNNYLRGSQLTDARIATVEKLGAFARERGHTLVELAFSWLASQPFVASVIAGATKPEQVASNAKAAEWQLTDEDFATVAEIVGQKVPA
jgi:aryl-alcohol dehydrogenase-like predicted oxidoreductase